MESPLPAEYDLKTRRLEASLTQVDMAKRLGVTPSQVLRYEAEPDNVPLRVVREWLAACGKPAADVGVDFGKPYAAVPLRLERLEDYARNQPNLTRDDTISLALHIGDLKKAIKELGRKPRVVLCGRFDAGKSRLANTLLGGDRLPTAYRPETRIVCLVRHLNDKPEWQAENVWIMDDRFHLTDADNREVCEQHRLLAGDFDTLRRCGTHQGESTSRDTDAAPGAVLVYVDAPFLHACDLIDTPGLGYDQADDALAGTAHAYGDAVLYLSVVTGFMDREDLRAVTTLVETLPAQPEADPLRGLFILATHAHPGVSDTDIESALNHGAMRLHQALIPLFKDKERTATPDAGLLRARMFPWYVETPARRKAFQTDLQTFLAVILPRAIHRRLDDTVTAFRSQVGIAYAHEAGQLQNLLHDQGVAAERLAAVLAAEPSRKRRVSEREQRVQQIIVEAKAATARFLQDTVAPLFTEDSIRMGIEARFSDAKEAEQQAGSVLLNEARALVERFLEERSAPLTAEVEALLGEYVLHVGNEFQQVTIPFDARAAFLGSLAGGGVFGALAGWAAVVAGGSNLGAYLLVPQVVSLLARLGIGIAGGTATGVSIVSALGGPVGIGIGIALSVGVLAWQVLGRSWQTRLAHKLAEATREKSLLGLIWVGCEQCWDDTLNAFNKAARETESQHLEHISRLQAQLQTPTETLRERLARVEARRAFLSFLPWTPLEGGKA